MGYVIDTSRGPYPNGYGYFATTPDRSSERNFHELQKDAQVTHALGLEHTVGEATDGTSDVLFGENIITGETFPQFAGWVSPKPIHDIVPVQQNGELFDISDPQLRAILKEFAEHTENGVVIGNVYYNGNPNELGKALSQANAAKLYYNQMRQGMLGEHTKRIMKDRHMHQRPMSGVAITFGDLSGESTAGPVEALASTGFFRNGSYVLFVGPNFETSVKKLAASMKVSYQAALQYIMVHEHIHTYAGEDSKGVSEKTLEGIAGELASKLKRKSPFAEMQRVYGDMEKIARKREGLVRKHYGSAGNKQPTYPSHSESHDEHGEGDGDHSHTGEHKPHAPKKGGHVYQGLLSMLGYSGKKAPAKQGSIYHMSQAQNYQGRPYAKKAPAKSGAKPGYARKAA